MYCNTNGLFNKISELQAATALYCVDFVCVTETHLNPQILDAEISLPGYHRPFRKDRDFSVSGTDSKTSGGGGSIIYARETLNCSLVDWFVVPDSVAIEVSTNIGSVNIACIYRSQALGRNQNQSIIKSIGKLAEHNEETIIYSDFNLTDVDWFAGYVNVPADSVNKTLVLQRDLMDQVL